MVCPNDMEELVLASEDPLLGTIIGGYQVLKRLGLGGMGAVYAAIETTIGKRAALKIVHPHLSNDPRLPSLLAEAKAVNAIGDVGIVDVYGFGTLPDGRSYLVMELLEGEPLETVMARHKFGILEAIELVLPLLSALEAAHSAGFVHRDIKSANVFIVRNPNRASFPKLLDFGIAQQVTTRSSHAMGTPDYVAPEQAANQNLGPHSDLYSLGCLFFELLTGHLPFRHSDPQQVVRMHQGLARPRVRAERSEVPEKLDALVLALMQVDPAERPSAPQVRSTLVELRDALKPKPRRWPLIAGAALVGALGLAAFFLRPPPENAPAGVGSDPVARAVAAAAEQVTRALDARTPLLALDKLLSAEGAFPARPEWVALRGKVGATLRHEAQMGVDRGDSEKALALLAAAARLAPVAPDDPLASLARRLAFAQRNGMVRVGDVFIDRYEYPNRKGAVPVTKVDWAEAVALCTKSGKHLCTEAEWQMGCGKQRYPWGDSLGKGRCFTRGSEKEKGPAASGSMSGCVGPTGIFDLVGNVAEWTASPLREGAPQRVTRGGSFGQSDSKLSCDARDYVLPGLGGAAYLGLRCCL